MEEMDEMLRENNPFVAIYNRMRQVLEEEYLQGEAENRSHQFVGMIISSDRKNLDQRRYNSLTTRLSLFSRVSTESHQGTGTF
jgi:hypothetical protein